MNIIRAKNKLTDIKDTIPFISKMIVDNVKDNFNENGQAILDNLNGIVGVAVKLLGRQIIDRYFENLAEEKCKNFGLGIYFKAACEQAEASLKNIDGVSLDLLTRKAIVERFEQVFSEKQEHIDNSDLVLHFTPKKHPAVSIIRSVCETVLEESIKDEDKENIIHSFTKDFNDHISARIISAFGDDYDKHIKEVDEKWVKSKEGKLLSDMVALRKIGFSDDEDLKYQETYAYWNKVDKYRDILNDADTQEDFEDKLCPVDELIEDYFGQDKDAIEKVLFILADFGKGKSVFLKQKASRLAKRYQQRGGGAIPVYFNLRDFDTYDQGSSHGIISEYLGKKYGIDVQDAEFQENEYVFLIDSLDECGNLTEERIDKVISSVKKIQNINVKKCRNNRIIITSRPIEHGLLKHLNSNDPYTIKNIEGRPVNYYISIYGFKREQFNDSLIDALKKYGQHNLESYEGISKEIMEAISEGQHIDIYCKFTELKLLTPSELRRPIFSYMIYKLIIGRADLSISNKVGIYLSFINVLTKEAKYMDSLKEVNLKDEYKFRNILHSTAALWMYETYKGNQGSLRKQDISNTVDGSVIDVNDQVKMSQYSDIDNIEFLSQSYFGQKGDIFYFQHQSFAEILLAEYYLKIFIHYALHESSTPEEARIRVLLGNPSEQTIDFFCGLLTLLKESVSRTEPDEVILHKRKLLLPLLASLSTWEFSKKLYSPYIKYRWFDGCEINHNTVEPPEALLKNWIITEEVLNKIIQLAAAMIGSKAKYLLSVTGDQPTSLFNKEVTQLTDAPGNIPPDIDRWLAFLVGNYLYNDEQERKFFAGTIEDYKIILDLMRSWNHYSGAASPAWGKKLFRGMNMSTLLLEESELEDYMYFVDDSHKNSLFGLNLREMDFSYSVLTDLYIHHCLAVNCEFIGVTFQKVTFSLTNLNGSNFSHAALTISGFKVCTLTKVNFNELTVNRIFIELCQINQGILFPIPLSAVLKGTESGLSDLGGRTFIGEVSTTRVLMKDVINTLKPLIHCVLEEGMSREEIEDCFIFGSDHDKTVFFDLLF
ncbi:pentapeptide repeat-containing protein [Paenibacillus tengchongensis]|uniref:pentapeptide repeat-containing protein n=1 Tax=Paenibacillus tengchongensis TaxID=2608684 RepID=UPI00124CE684|nr:pentapeptide repeat-containing protein [Paenibacillus tengchongensis]